MFPLQDSTPRRQTPLVTATLIIANCVVFAFELSVPTEALERIIYLFGTVPARFAEPVPGRNILITAGSYWPFLTSMFLHGGWMHIISNMWILWIFGDNVEDRMGHLRFLIFYLICGIASAAFHVVTNINSTVPAIGASGAIAGVLGAYFLLFPLARIIVVLPILFWPLFFELPAFVYLGIWFFMQFFSGTLSLVVPQSASGIAWWAHIGGFLTGIALYRLFVIRRKPKRRLFLDEYGPRGAWFRT